MNRTAVADLSPVTPHQIWSLCIKGPKFDRDPNKTINRLFHNQFIVLFMFSTYFLFSFILVYENQMFF